MEVFLIIFVNIDICDLNNIFSIFNYFVIDINILFCLIYW